MQKIVKNNKGNKEKNVIKKQTGITLIALVITIIVLLILAGVSIAMLTGNNGILTQAKLAKENTALAKEDEENKLAKNNEYINEQIGKVVPGKVVAKTEKDNYSDGTDTATVPEGFTVDETENTISKGLVVHGPDKANDNGSEFVWVPVPDINNMAQCSTAGGSCNLQLDEETLKCTTHNSTDIVGKIYSTKLFQNEIDDTANTTYSDDSELKEPAIVKDYDNYSSYNTIGLQLSDMQRDYRNMAAKVAKYGGFYVGRYETSLSNATSSQANNGNAQSKPGVIPTSAANSATSSWYGLYKIQDKTYTGKNNSVESSMIWGSQYDAIINWVKNGNNEIEIAKLTNRRLGNNSSRSVTTTGNSNYSNDSINNIRDLGGNLREWTLEAYGANSRVNRGGGYYSTFSPSYRNSDIPNNSSSNYGSRLTLYIK